METNTNNVEKQINIQNMKGNIINNKIENQNNYNANGDIVIGDKTEIKGDFINQQNIYNNSKNDKDKNEDRILFLQIEKDNKNNLTAKLESKPYESTNSLIESVNIDISKFFFDRLNDLENLMRTRTGTRISETHKILTEQLELENMGIEIYNTFFTKLIKKDFENIWDLFEKKKIKKLILVINSPEPKILNIPFEMMRIDKGSMPFVLSRDNFLLTHTTEKKFEDFEITGLEPLAPPLKMLVVSSLPEDMPEVDRFLELENEQEKIIESLGDLVSKQKVVVEFLEIASLKEIEKALEKGGHNIIHISGHGSHQENTAGYLYLENEDGNTDKVSGENFADCIKKYSSVNMVILSACETATAEEYGVAGALIKAEIPAVIGMRYPVSDKAATIFTSKFYEGLCAGEPLSKALFNSRKNVLDFINEENKKLLTAGENNFLPAEWFAPFLYLNQNIQCVIDYKKERTDTKYFFQKPVSLIEGGKYVGKGFIGRHKQLIELTKMFRAEKRNVLIYGQGGIGKTTLSIRFADNFENGSYKIIQFRGEVTEEKILKKFAEEASEDMSDKKAGEKIIKIINSPNYKPENKLNILIEQYFSKEKIIILFDNFEDNQKQEKDKKIYQTEIQSESLKKFLTLFCKNITKPSYIIFTSRYKFSMPKIPVINLSEMSFPDTFKLINKFSHLVQLTLFEKKQVHIRLGGHPRALELLESYLIKEKINWQDVESKFPIVEETEQNQDLLFDMLYDILSETEKAILKSASVFRNLTNFDALKSVTGFEKEEIEKSILKLNKLSLCYLEGNRFYVHRLTSSYILKEKTDGTERKAIHKKAAEYFENIKDKECIGFVECFLEARWHYLQCEEFDKAAELTFSIEAYLTRAGYPQISFELIQEILQTNISEKNKAITLNQLGILYQGFGEYDKALGQYQISLEIAEKTGNIADVSKSLHQIGIVYQYTGNYDKALEQYQISLEIAEKTGDIADVSKSLHQIGMVYQSTGNYEKALEQYQKSLEIKERISDLAGVSKSFQGIGNIYYLTGSYEKALEQYQKSLEIKEKIGDLGGVSSSLHQIGMVYQSTGNYEKALEKYQKSLEIRKKIGDIAGVAKSFHQIGRVYQATGNYEKALEQYQKSLDIKEKIGDIAGVASSLHQIGMVYQYTSKNEKALEQYQKSLEIVEKIGDIAGVAKILHNIGAIYQDTGNYEKALEKYQKSLEIAEKIGNISGVSSSLHQIGIVYQLTGNYKKALDQYQKSLEIRGKIGDISGIANSYGQISRLLFETKKYSEALKNYLKAYSIFFKIGSPNAGLVQKWINETKTFISETEFNAIVNEFNKEIESQKTETTEDSEKQFFNFIIQLTSVAISAKSKSLEEKQKIIEAIKNSINKLPADAPENEGIKNYFQMLMLVAEDKDYQQFKEKVPIELYSLFKKTLNSFEN